MAGVRGALVKLMLVTALTVAAADRPSQRAAIPAAKPAGSAEVELRGRVVPLTGPAKRAPAAAPAADQDDQWGFQTTAGRCYKLRRTRYSEALFVDPRLRKKELLLKGRFFPDAHTLDVSSMRSIRNGVVCDLYYYCAVCAIKAIAPGPCMCCQRPVELVEKPLAQSRKD